MASLFVIRGQDQGKRFELTSPVVSVGRDTTSTIRLRDTEVSRHHAELRHDVDAAEFSIVDLGSSNGTFINSEPVQSHVLQNGDRVQLGRTLMIFTMDDEPGVNGRVTGVDIVAPAVSPSNSSQSANSFGVESHIVQSLPNDDGSFFMAPITPEQSPWLARARSNLQIMYRTALAVSHTMDIDQLLVRIMDLIFEWVEADRGCVMLVDQESNELIPKARRNRPGIKSNDRIAISRTIIDYVMNHREGVLTSDAREDQRWDGAASIVTMGVREAIAVPMQGRYGIVGLIYIDTYTAPGKLLQGGSQKFQEEHLKLMIAIAHQAALAVEDTSYYSAMVQAERLAAIGQTIAGLSHHIKNILQGIRGGSYLIEEGLNVNQPDVVRKGWRIVEKNQEKISRLVLDMLTFSKEREPEMVPWNLNRVVADVVELMQSRAEDNNVSLRVVADEQMPDLLLDPDGLHHALLNIVTNAIDACDKRPDGLIEVATDFDVAGDMVRITVTDNGRGIADSDLSKIFVLFESTKGNRGTGLGLSVSQKIVREMGGEIRVSSQEGVGSCFAIELPALRIASAKPRETSAGNDRA